VLVIGLLLLVLGATGSPAPAASPGPAEAKNVALIGHLDVEGGGMVDVQGALAAIGHIDPPYATTLVDVSDITKPKILSRIKTWPGTHSHKARLCGNTLIINVEKYRGWKKGEKVGLAFFDVADPANPKEVTFMEMGGVETLGSGVHRYQVDCPRKLVYLSGSADGYLGNISLIVDFSDPKAPKEVGRWWIPGQWAAGGEKPTWKGDDFRTHHPLRWGDRLYISLWFGGFAIVDISDISKPRTVSSLNYHPPYESPTHTALRVGHKILGRDWLLVFDEDVQDACEHPPAFMLVVDITNERLPVPVANFQAPEGGKYSYCDGQRGKRFGSHQPYEYVGEDNLVYAAWFSGGLRIVDISNPYRPREAGYYVPEPVAGFKFPLSNDVFLDKRGVIYLIDRYYGLDLLKFTGERKTRWKQWGR
jgi:hypothetical protein